METAVQPLDLLKIVTFWPSLRYELLAIVSVRSRKKSLNWPKLCAGLKLSKRERSPVLLLPIRKDGTEYAYRRIYARFSPPWFVGGFKETVASQSARRLGIGDMSAFRCQLGLF